jgi:arylsulfatase A-like enzyme
MGDREIRGLKGYTTEAGTHVPLIASWPGTIAPSQVNDNLVDFTDFLPTLLEAAQIDASEGIFTDGLSFYPQLLGQADTVRSWVFCDYAPRWGGFPHQRYVHDRDWKLYDDGRFYHISVDPEESFPVADDALTADVRRHKQDFQEVLGRMRDNLESHPQRSGRI